MKAELRDILGRAAYETVTPALDDSAPGELIPRKWEEVDPRVREAYRLEAEAVINRFAAILIPTLMQTVFTEEQLKVLIRSMI